MAKFRQGNLVLQSLQEIIQGGNTILDASGALTPASLNVSGASALTTLELASGVEINEFSIDGTLVDDSDSAVPTEKAVKTYVDAQVGGAIAPGVEDSIARYEGTNTVQDCGIFIDNSNNITGVNSLDSTTITCVDLKLESGATINEFSIDGTLAGDSDSAVPTEKAVKTYVDTSLVGISTNQIIEDDSYVKVVDDGTAVGYVEIVTDGVQVSYWDAEAATIRLGKVSGAGRLEISDTELNMYVGAGNKLSIVTDSNKFGDISSSSYFEADEAGTPSLKMVHGGVTIFQAFTSNINMRTPAINISRPSPTGTAITQVSLGNNANGRGLFDIFGNGPGSPTGAEIHLVPAADYDGTISNYAFAVYQDDLLIGPSTDTDALKYDGGINKWLLQAVGGTELYHSGNKVSETTANGITGAVWG